MQKTILVVEDERALIDAVKEKLEREDFQVESASSVEQAREIMNKKDIHVIWLDHYLLGQETGLDFVGELKAHDTWKNIPIFVVSNTAGPDKVQTYMKLGVEKYYVKAKTRLDIIIEDIKQIVI